MANATDMAGGGAATPAPPSVMADLWQRYAPKIGWTIVSVGMFALIWEVLWLLGLADPKLLPPPHVFMGDLSAQAKNFNTAQRWQIGAGASDAPSQIGRAHV